jgi:hypothetical protein
MSWIKLVSIGSLITVGSCFAMTYVLSYWMGYYERSYSPLAYRDLLVPIIGFLASAAILITWLVSISWKKHRLWTTGMMSGLLVLIGFG